MPISTFLAHIATKAPAFRCYKSGDRSKEIGFTASVKNSLGKPASSQSLSRLDELLGSAGRQIRALFAVHDGATLYGDSKSDAAGLTFFRVQEWEEASDGMRQEFEEMGVSVDEMPEWFSSGVVFGEIPHSANYFLIGTAEPNEGAIFYVDHDDFQSDALAQDFDSFLELIASDPSEFMFNRGCYTRYSDGRTQSQWIPVEYVTNDVSS